MFACHYRSKFRFPAALVMMSVSIAMLASVPSVLQAQGLTGQIGGSVQDPSGTAVVGATVELTNSETNQSRNVKSDATGLPGTYRVAISLPGFKRFEQRDIILTATERAVLRPIVLELGALTESVSVTAEAAFPASTREA